MAISVGKLDKFKAPAPGGVDPMLDESAIGAEEEGAMEEGESPLAAFSDDELMEECMKRGMDVKLPEAEAMAEGESLEQEDAENELY